MNDLLNFYVEDAKAKMSGIPWLHHKQEKALRDFEQRAFPSRHDEDWKYTLMDPFLAERFASVSCQDQAITVQVSGKQPLTGLEIHLHNGKIDLSQVQGLPKGVTVLPLLDAMVQYPDRVQAWLGKLLQQTHGFHALNMAALQTGVFIYLAENVTLDTPLILSHWQDESGLAVHSRNLVVAEANANASVVEIFQGQDSCKYLTNTITEIQLAAGAKLKHYKVQCESHLAFHVGHTAVQQGAASEFESHLLNLGARIARSDLSVNLAYEGAHCLMNGLYLPNEGQHMDQHTTVHHLVPNCSSEEDYKGIIMGKSRAVFNGKVVVAKGAIHTRAEQENKNLLLSELAEIDTKPQLEIFADDVLCSHGATVGQLDEEALFYMAARGIPAEEARRYLIEAFAEDNLARIPYEELKCWMADLITAQLR